MSEGNNGGLPTEATLHHLLIREGSLSAADAVAWADGWILRLDSWPDEPLASTGFLTDKIGR